MIAEFCMAQQDNAAMAEFIAPLRAKAGEWQQLSQAISQRAQGDADEIGAAAYDYLFYSGYVVLAYWWARSVAVAEASPRPEAFKRSKRETARFYFQRILPRTGVHAQAIGSGAASLMSLPDADFDA